MRIQVEAKPVQEVNITPLATAIVRVMVKPYNDLLAKMLKDGRVTEAEMKQLHERVYEQADRLDELVQEDLARLEPRLDELMQEGVTNNEAADQIRGRPLKRSPAR